MIRSLFIPEEKHTWGCFDYSQQEPRLVVHYAAFSRAIGEVTDIVEKEMYTWEDNNGNSLTLRPEGTASVVE